MIASCGFLENELSHFSKEEGVTLADSVETLGVDLRTRVRKLGAEEKARRKKCKVRFSIVKKNSAEYAARTLREFLPLKRSAANPSEVGVLFFFRYFLQF